MGQLRISLYPVVRRLLHFYWRFSRGATLGVRAMVIDRENRVFLIRHTYVSCWHLPGGGVEVGETMARALARELREEGNIELTGLPSLHGVYFNVHASRRDHVALFVVRDFRQTGTINPNFEIADCGFFPRGKLPADTTEGTRRRIAEVFDGHAVSDVW
jgi:ADP-ribose pyrophosphatase YjhB (NUDIX family)